LRERFGYDLQVCGTRLSTPASLPLSHTQAFGLTSCLLLPLSPVSTQHAYRSSSGVSPPRQTATSSSGGACLMTRTLLSE
jgi:hypothetical protein